MFASRMSNKCPWWSHFVVAFLIGIFGRAQQLSPAKQMANAVIKRWPDGHIVANHQVLGDWAYDKNTLLAGFAELWQTTGDPAYYHYLQRSIDRLITADGSIPSYRPQDFSLDEIALGRELLLLYGRSQQTRYYRAATVIRQQLDSQPRTPSGGFWHKKRYPNQMWLDGLYMAEPFYAQYAEMFQEPQAFDDIAKQFSLIEAHTRDPRTGLLYHGWDESKQMSWANQETGAAPIVWARALGWYAMALIDTIPHFPLDHPGRAHLLAMLNRLAPALVSVQDVNTGLWYEVLDRGGQPGNYFESSASCMFVYALEKGVRLGYLDPKFQQNAKRGYDGILKHFVTDDTLGNLTLTQTVYGAGLSSTLTPDNSYEYYTHVAVGPTDPKGIGAFLLAASEMETASIATLGRRQVVILDAWYNSQTRRNAAGQKEFFHYKWTDYADSGFSTFDGMFRAYGAQTRTLYSAPTASNLKTAQIYIIVSPDIPARNLQPHYVEPADVKVIHKWVKQGGVLLILENDVGNAEFEHLNRLSDRFGIHFNPVLRNRVEDSHWEMGKVTVPAKTLVFLAPHMFYMKEISTITARKPARAVVTDSGDVIMAMARYGKGTVFAVTDPWLYNEYTDGLKLPSEYENYEGGKELVHWLLLQSLK